MGFTKLDSNIIQSSIMSEPAVVFKVWIALLASAGPDGIARVSSTFLSSVCYLDLDAVDRALGILEAPDARSRSLAQEGRRIRRVDGGYFIVNYEKYRAFTPHDGDPNSSGAARTRRWRERKSQSVTASPVVTPSDVTGVTSASAYASESDSSSKGEVQERETDAKFEEFWKAYPQAGRLAKKESRVKFGALVKRGELEQFIKGFHGYLDFLKHQRLQKRFDLTPMYAKTFLNGRWQEYVGFKYEAEL